MKRIENIPGVRKHKCIKIKNEVGKIKFKNKKLTKSIKQLAFQKALVVQEFDSVSDNHLEAISDNRSDSLELDDKTYKEFYSADFI